MAWRCAFRMNSKNGRKRFFRLQKIEMEQKALRAQMNPHFFFNALNSVQQFISANEPEKATFFLSRFSRLMRNILENSENAFIPLEDEVQFLTNYLTIEKMRFKDRFAFSIHVDSAIDGEWTQIPTMLIQPFLENAIKHGVSGREDGFVSVEFREQSEKTIRCIIQDNGKGRSASVEQDQSTGSHRSMGLRVTEERVAALAEQFALDLSVEIIDLYDDDGTPEGTRIELILPVGQ